jgi:Ca-activated chloride channel family protein
MLDEHDMKKLLFSLILIFISDAHAGLFSNYSKKTPEEVIQSLAIEQIDNPDDPYLNYNLGVALYQTQKYDAAKNNFERATNNAKNPILKDRCFFNLANSCYKNAISKLPASWEKPDTKIDPKELDIAINDTKSAIKNYENILEKDKDNKPAKTNLNKAKELLEKLLKKQQEQKQDNKDNKQDEKNKQDQKQDQNKDNKQEEKNKQDQKQDQSKDKQENKQDKQEQQQSQENQKQQDSQSKEKTEQQKQSQDQQENKQEQQQVQQAQVQQASDKQAKQEKPEEKSMRMMLENLQSDEDSLQKAIIQRQTKDQKPLESGQKPW